MTHFSLFGLGAISGLLVAMSLGCSSEQQSKPNATTATPPTTSVSEMDSDMNDAFSKLSPADRKLAQEQEICPVSDEPLGSMGTPIKVTVDGRDVFVCCAGCEDELKKNFDEYVAKLEKRSGQK